MVTSQSSELGWEVTVELPADFLSLGRGSVNLLVISRDLIVFAATNFLVTALINGRDIVCSRDLIFLVFLQY